MTNFDETKTIDAETLWNTPIPLVRWVVPDLLPAGLSILAGEEQDEAVERELHTAIHEMRGYIRETYAGTAGLQEMMQQLEEQVMNIESLHLS